MLMDNSNPMREIKKLIIEINDNIRLKTSFLEKNNEIIKEKIVKITT